MKTNLKPFLLEVFDELKPAVKHVRALLAQQNAVPFRAVVRQPSEAVFFVARRVTERGFDNIPYDWCFVIESVSRGSPHARVFLFLAQRDGEFHVNTFSLCATCGNNTTLCAHTRGLIEKACNPDDMASEFHGVFRDNDWGVRDPDVYEAPWDMDEESRVLDPLLMLQQFARDIKSKKSWPDGQQVVLRLKNTHVVTADGSRRPIFAVMCRSASDGLSEADPYRFELPAEEVEWHQLALAMGRVQGERMHFIARDSDKPALMRFAKAGRLLSESGQIVSYAGGTEALVGWIPSDSEGQRLVAKLERPWLWMAGDAGPVLDTHGTTIADTEFSREQIEALLLIPDLGDADAQQIRQEWAANPRLAGSLLPLAPASRNIEVRQLKWSGEASNLQTEDGTRVSIKVTLLDGDKPVHPDTKDGKLVQIDGDLWHRYLVPDHESSLRERLKKLYFTSIQERDSIIFLAPELFTQNELALVLTLLDDATWIKLPADAKAQLLPTKADPNCVLTCQVVEVGKKKGSAAGPTDLDKQRPPYELVLSVSVGGHSINPKAIHGFTYPHIGTHQDALCNMFGGGADDDLIEIQPGKFAILDGISSHNAMLSLDRLLDHATMMGNRYFLTEGAILRLATTTGLPIQDSPILHLAREKVEKLLVAQGDAEEMVIPGIDDITFSPKQASGVRWLVTLLELGLGGILADKRGAGKTFQSLGAIALSRAWRKKNKKGPAIVMMELKELDHWVLKHLMGHCSGLKWEVFHGNHKPSDEALLKADLVVTTYGVFQRHVERFRALDPGFVFADEAKRLKNRQSKTTQAIQTLTKASIISINGTPLTKNVADVWTSFNLAAPGFLGSSARFGQSYRQNADDPAYLERLRHAMAPLFIRRDIDNGRGMPSKTLIPQFITMDAAQIETYQAARARILDQKQQMLGTMTGPQMRFKLRLLLDRLRDITASPGTAKKMTSKGETIQEMVSEFVQEGHQVLVFSHSNTYVDAIAEILRSEGIPTSVYRGSNAKERNREKALFQEGHSRVLVLSDLGAKGLDLPEASRVVITDPWIDADEEDQKADRARRFTSTKDLEVFYLICAGTIEEGAMHILERNRAQEQAILEGAPAPAPSKGLKASTDDYDHLLSFTP